ncbi:D-2-hydroxyacid dehydrogenase [Tamlana fucoidanivorans]|uniref:D-2-hydroxyacid dehydrogenase n=1 Tax=Allotamlana fucoidanivorans TaxID=2583814 RepID=A0A5C4SRZ6_9FLAO|nr:D-2-hydroxyacid dehydrogenase [Tamlana fucoidanivorans]TNJ46599.1 D-2-hydroxyacid dehydrogenase [Tamlana fucoidanivorans]
MKIVVLDGYTLNPGDLSWKDIDSLGTLQVYDRTPFNEATILDRVKHADVILTNKTPLSKQTIKNAKNLKYIGVLATGYNVVDTETAKKNNIVVCNVPSYSTVSVAQFTIALILELCHHIGQHSQAVLDGAWSKSPDFSFWNSPLIELQGKTLGIIGFGDIGQATAKLAQAFGMRIITFSRTKYPELESNTCQFVTLDYLFKNSDIISLHCPLLKETEGIINKRSIEKMKQGVMIVNTARGPLIIEKDLKEALNSGKVYGAALDVVSKEPIELSNPLLSAKNCILTPHIAWAPKEARMRLMETTFKNIKAFKKGKPMNVVNN